MVDDGRRNVLRAASALGLAVGFRTPRAASATTDLTFCVAGVRYQASPREIAEGEQLELQWARGAHGEACALRSRLGERLGYVPKSKLRLLRAMRHPVTWLERFEPHAVPWKRYVVGVRDGAERG